jgi:hypothetical protein
MDSRDISPQQQRGRVGLFSHDDSRVISTEKGLESLRKTLENVAVTHSPPRRLSVHVVQSTPPTTPEGAVKLSK